MREFRSELQAVGDGEDAFGGIVTKRERGERDRRDKRLQKSWRQIDDEALDSAKAHLLKIVCQGPNMPVHEKRSAWSKQVEN